MPWFHIIELAIYLRKEKCRRHWIIVASYAETPLGVSNQRSLFAKRGKVNGWLGRCTYNSLLLCKGHDEACRKPKGLHFYISISKPAISLPPMGQLHSWLLSSDAYGIFHANFDYLTKILSPTKNRLSPLLH